MTFAFPWNRGPQGGRRPTGRWLAGLRLSRRLALGFGLVLGLVLAITLTALHQMSQMESRTRDIVESSNRRMAAAHGMLDASGEAFISLYGLLLATDDVDVKTQAGQYQAALARYDAQRQAYEGLLPASSTEAAKQLKELDTAASPSRTMNQNLLRTASAGGNVTGAFNSMDPRPAQDEWRRQVAGLVKLEADDAARTYEAAKVAMATARRVLIVATLVAFAIGGFAAFTILRSVTHPIREAIGHARRIAGGDLGGDVVVRSRDEVGHLLEALGQMQSQLRGIVRSMRASTDSIATASREIAQGNQDLSSRTEKTASSLQQTASSMEQLNGTVVESARAAAEADQLASAASLVARRGGDVVHQVVGTMDEIQASSRRIADITGVIDGIAFQTNILALNAAVEAARAGDHGRGFAVVASEVRALAQRSAGAAREIKALIGSSVDKVEAGTRLVDAAGATMQEIVESVKRVGDIVNAISRASGAQSEGIGQVSAAVTHVDAMTQQNAALVEQSAAAAESLRQQATQLAQAVSVFKLETDAA